MDNEQTPEMCPKCGHIVEYGSMVLEENQLYYPYKCPNCLDEGKEWYSINFIEIKSNGDKTIEDVNIGD